MIRMKSDRIVPALSLDPRKAVIYTGISAPKRPKIAPDAPYVEIMLAPAEVAEVAEVAPPDAEATNAMILLYSATPIDPPSPEMRYTARYVQ